MIIHLKNQVTEHQAQEMAKDLQAISFKKEDHTVIVTSFKMNTLPVQFEPLVDECFVMESDIQLASKAYVHGNQKINIGNSSIGKNTNTTMMIAGPCSVESMEQIEQVADTLKKLNIKTLRAGCFKPRTSPYTFQGLGEDGLKMLDRIRNKYDFNIITEVKDSSHVDLVIEYADIIQIGAKAMYDQSILRRCGQSNKPVLLKRGFGTTLQEFVQAAEFILSAGNDQVMLCERGIRTFETKTRFTLDLCGVAFLKEHTNLPVVVDPSHAMGYRYGVADLTRASLAMGVEGLIIETHPNPEVALSDAAQQLNLNEFKEMYASLLPLAEAIGRKLI